MSALRYPAATVNNNTSTNNTSNNNNKVEKNVPCPQCKKLYANAERVRIHVRRVHQPKPPQQPQFPVGIAQFNQMKPAPTRSKNFVCDNCGRSFSQGYHLRRHQMIHTGERPYQCEVCGRAFYRKDKLSRHRRVHLNAASRSANAGGNRSANATTSSNQQQVNSGNANMSLAHQQILNSMTAGMQIFPVGPLDAYLAQHSNLVSHNNQNNLPASTVSRS